MFLQIENVYITWYGKFSTIEEQEATEDMVRCFQVGCRSLLYKYVVCISIVDFL